MRLRVWVGRLLFCLACGLTAKAADVLTVEYPASEKAGELLVEAKFHMWLPPEAKRIRGIIVHQHGCGDGAEDSGERAALDLHWRALAAKHDCALISPRYRAKGANCRLWCDPRNGSGNLFLRAIADLASKSGHSEIAEVPWCLWGHSGGAFWSSLMLERHPERIVAIFLRSGVASTSWLNGDVPPVNFSDIAYGVPIILNPGVKEKGDAQFNGAWEASVTFFERFRAKGAPVAFAPDPKSGHDCRNSRLMAIPFFDACLEQRLPKSGAKTQALRPIVPLKGFIGNWETGAVEPAKKSAGGGSWLPDEDCARAYSEYVKTGMTTDRSGPKKAPEIISVRRGDAGEVVILFTAEADFESGIRQFAIYRDGKFLKAYPENPRPGTDFPQFQGISYHDTPTPDLLPLRFIDESAWIEGRPSYSVSMLNGAGVEGSRSAAVRVDK